MGLLFLSPQRTRRPKSDGPQKGKGQKLGDQRQTSCRGELRKEYQQRTRSVGSGVVFSSTSITHDRLEIPALEIETQGASCLNIRYSIVLIALVLKWIQGKKSRESKRVPFFLTWRSVICKWIRIGIVYQKGLFIWNGLLAKVIKMDN